jgi:hypothetical protein
MTVSATPKHNSNSRGHLTRSTSEDIMQNPFSHVRKSLNTGDTSQADYGYLDFALRLSAAAFDTESNTESDANPYAAVLRRWRAAGLLAGHAGQRFEQMLTPFANKFGAGGGRA